MNPAFNSIVLVSTQRLIDTQHSDFIQFFNSIEATKKDLIIFEQQPITDYTNIKKIHADDIIIFYQKDFYPFNLSLKPKASQVLKSRTYDIIVHFNVGQYISNTYKICNQMHGKIKISNIVQHSKKFSIIIHHSDKYLQEVSDYLKKLII